MNRHSLTAFALATLLLMGSAFAQQPPPSQPAPAPPSQPAPPAQPAPPSPLDRPGRQDLVQPPASLPKLKRWERFRNLDFLFGALKVAPDAASAKNIEDRIWAIWLASGSDTCTLLMTRVKAAVDAEKYDLALRLLNAIIELKPTYIEAWNRRATVYFLKKDYANAIADLAKVLTLEPRHFGALTGLGAILQDIGNDKEALKAFRAALAIDPHLQGALDKVKALTVKVEGQDI